MCLPATTKKLPRPTWALGGGEPFAAVEEKKLQMEKLMAEMKDMDGKEGGGMPSMIDYDDIMAVRLAANDWTRTLAQCML